MNPIRTISAALALAATIAIGGTATAAFADTVQPGQTLSGIAAEHGTTYQHLAAINGISDPNVIYVGEHISVDGGGGNDQPVVQSAVQYQAAPPVQQAAPVQSSGGGGSSDLDWIIQHESGGSTTAVNPSSGTYGLAQWLPGTGPGAGTSYATQYAAAEQYAVSRYGSDANAKAFWEANSWW